MELLKKINKNYLSVSFSMLMAIILALGVGSCKCGGDGGGEDATGKLAISVDKEQGTDTKRNLTIKATELTKPADFKFVAKLTSKSPAGGGVKLTINGGTEHKVKLGVDFEKDLADFLGAADELNEGDEKTVQIDFEPSTEKDLTLVVEIWKGEEVVSKTVGWTEAAVITLGVTSDKATIEGAEKAAITIKNNSAVDVKPSDITVLFNVNNNATFDLGTAAGKKEADSHTLDAILGNNNVIATGATVSFEVKLANDNGQKKSELSFTMTHSGGDVAFAKTKVVEWQMPVVVLGVSSDKPTIEGAEKAVITIKNNSATIAVTPSDVTVLFNVNNNATFDLGTAAGKKEADSQTLEAILGNNNAIATGATVSFEVKLANDNGQKKSELSFTMTHSGGGVAFTKAKVVEWQVPVVVLGVTSDKPTIESAEKATITIKNNSTTIAVTPSDVTVLLNVNNDATFDLGSAAGKKEADSQTLDVILGNNNVIATGTTVTFEVKLNTDNGKKASALSFTMTHSGGDIAFAKAKVVEWQVPVVVLGVTSDKPTIEGAEKAVITIKNNSLTVAVTPSDVTVVFNVDNNATFDLGSALGKKEADSQTLDVILGNNNVIATGATVSFEIKLANAKGKKKSELSFTMTHSGGDVAFAKAKVVEWQVPIVVLGVKSDKPTIESAEKATITIKNNSKVGVTPGDVTVLLNVNNDATFDLGSAAGKKEADSQTLDAILGNNNVIATGATVSFEIKLNDAKGKKTSKLSFTMTHSGGNVAFAKKEVVEWQVPVVVLEVNSDKPTIESAEKATITIKNKSLTVAVIPADMTVLLNVDNDAIFDLGAQAAKGDTYSGTLHDILGNNNPIAVGATVTFEVKLNDAKGKKKSELSFTMTPTGGGVAFAKAKVVEWQVPVVVLGIKSDKPTIGSAEKATITIKNNSITAAVKPSDVTVVFNVDNNATFDLGSALGKKEADSQTLDAILGNNNAIAVGATASFEVKLANAKGQRKSELSFTLNHSGGDVAFAKAKVVEWQVPVIKLGVVSSKLTIKDGEKATITIKNNSKLDVTPGDVTVLLNVNNDATFDLGAQAAKGDTYSGTLHAILSNNNPIVVGATVSFEVKLANANGKKKSELSFTMIHSGGDIAFTKKKVVEWQGPVIILGVTSDKSTIESAEKATITVKNNSTGAITPSDVTVVFNVNNTGRFDLGANNATFDLGTAAGKKEADSQTLDAILGNNNAIAIGATVTFEVKLNNDNGKKASALSFTMTHSGGDVAFTKAKVVEWQVPVALDVTSNKIEIKGVKGAEVATITVKNTGGLVITAADVAVVLNVNNGAKFDLGAETQKADGESLTLLDIVGGINKPIKPGNAVDFEIKLGDENGQIASALSLTVSYKGKQVSAKKKLLDWNIV